MASITEQASTISKEKPTHTPVKGLIPTMQWLVGGAEVQAVYATLEFSQVSAVTDPHPPCVRKPWNAASPQQ